MEFLAAMVITLAAAFIITCACIIFAMLFVILIKIVRHSFRRHRGYRIGGDRMVVEAERGRRKWISTKSLSKR